MSAAPFADLALERQVLGQMLGSPGAYEAYLAAGLREDDFFRDAHRHVFAAITTIAAHAAPDLVTVALALKEAGRFEEVGPAYFAGLTEGTAAPTEGAVAFVTARLADLAGHRAIQRAHEQGLDAVSQAAETALTRGQDDRRTYDSRAQLDAVRADVVRDAAGRIFLGFDTLDNTLDGIRPGEVFGLMARPGIGKTLVLGHIARAVADTAIGHVFFSLEMPAAQIVERLARAHYGLSRGYFRERLERGGLDPEDYTQAFARFVLVDAPGLSVAQMAGKLRQIQATVLKGIPIRLVTVDHLGLIGGDRRMSTYDRVSTQARELKEFAKRFGVSLVLAVQVNRESGGDGSKELSLGSARDSGVVEEAMDYLVAMRRLDRSQSLASYEREKYRDVLFLKIIKHRHGAPDTEIGVRIDGMTLALREDPTVQITNEDLTKVAAMPLRGRR